MSVSAQRPVASRSSTQRFPNPFRIPTSNLHPMNSSSNNISASVPPHQPPLFPPVRIPTSMHGSLRTHTQPLSSAPMQENGLGQVHQTASASGLPEMPPEEDWRPTGRMRGSLTGEAYSAALNQYSVLPNSQNPNNNTNPSPNPIPTTGGSNLQSNLSQAGRRWY